MSRAHQLFRQSDISRAIVAVEKAGKSVTRVEIDHNGSIVVDCSDPIDVVDPSDDLDLTAIMRGEDGTKRKRVRGS